MKNHRLREAGRRGGRQAQLRGTAHQLTPRERLCGGLRTTQRGTGHRWTSAEATIAGRKSAEGRRGMLKTIANEL